MVKLLLTDAKQHQKFLVLPFEEQVKQGLLLDINNNEGVECLTDTENEQANESCESFFVKTFLDVKQKDVVDHFGDYCQKGKEVFQKNLVQLDDSANLDDLCDGKHSLMPKDTDFFMHVNIEPSGYNDKTFNVDVDIPLLVNSNPKQENPHDWLQFVRELQNLEANLGLQKESPFYKHDRHYNKALNKYYEQKKYGIKKKKPVYRHIPKVLLGETISTEFPDDDKDVVMIGFLNEDEEKSFFVKQKFKK